VSANAAPAIAAHKAIAILSFFSVFMVFSDEMRRAGTTAARSHHILVQIAGGRRWWEWTQQMRRSTLVAIFPNSYLQIME
jgi:hypothetical protein